MSELFSFTHTTVHSTHPPARKTCLVSISYLQVASSHHGTGSIRRLQGRGGNDMSPKGVAVPVQYCQTNRRHNRTKISTNITTRRRPTLTAHSPINILSRLCSRIRTRSSEASSDSSVSPDYPKTTVKTTALRGAVTKFHSITMDL